RRLRRPVLAARVDAFRGHREMEVLAGLQPGALLEDRLQHLAGRARPGRRLEHDHLAALQHPGEAVRRALDVRQVGLALRGERRRQRDQHGVRLAHERVVRGGDDGAALDERAEPLGGDVLDVALAAVEGVDERRRHVDEEDALPAFGEGGGERQSDVPGADDGDVVEGGARHDAQAYRAAATRSAAWPSPYRGGAAAGNRAAARAVGIASGSASVFAPASTVSTHSVLGRTVTHGTRSQYASFCSPPESVTTALADAVRSSISRKPSGSIACTFGGS